MEIEVARAELLSAIGSDRHFVGQHPVLIVEDFQRTRIFCLGRGAFIPTGYEDCQPIVGGHPHLMGIDTGVDWPRLFYLFAWREVLVDAVDA